MIRHLISFVSVMRFLPHLWIYYRFKDKSILDYERDMYLNNNNITQCGWRGFILLLQKNEAYRSVFYFRTGRAWLNLLAKGLNDFYICMNSNQIGKGLMVWHGYSTILNAQYIGENFQIWHNVTIGKKTTEQIVNKPVIGNNVSICTGAVVVGNITIGNNVVIGANATVVKNVPDNSVVVNQPSRIIQNRI